MGGLHFQVMLTLPRIALGHEQGNSGAVTRPAGEGTRIIANQR